jgi:hypothetical protein
LAAAQAESFLNLTKTGLNINEYSAVYQFTWHGLAAYGTSGKCRLAAAPVRMTVSASGVSNTVSLDHEGLTGLLGGATGEHYHLTAAQLANATGLFSSGSPGLAPATSGSSGKFLRDDATWQAAGGGHDHGVARVSGSAGQTTFALPDFASMLEIVTVGGIALDPSETSLNVDGDQLIISPALAATAVLQVNYMMAVI